MRLLFRFIFLYSFSCIQHFHCGQTSDFRIQEVERLFQSARISSDVSLLMRAYSLVNKRLRQSPDEISTCIWKGKLENSLHAYEFAIETLKTCYRLNPDPEIQGQIAEVYLHQDRIAEARKALELSSKTKIRFLYHAREALLSKKMGQLDASHAQWDMALDSYDRMDPEPPAWVLVEIGDLYRLQGKEAQATANYQKSLGLVPRYGPALRGLKALRSQGRSQSGSKSVRLPVKSSEQ